MTNSNKTFPETAYDQSQIRSFIKRQIEEVKKGGRPIFVRKLRLLPRIGRDYALMLVAFPIVLAVRLAWPIITIRFGPIRSDRVGHFAPELELYLCEKSQEKHGRNPLDIFYFTGQICNQQLGKMWARVVPVNGLVRWVDMLNRCLPGGRRHTVPRRTLHGNYDIHGILDNTPPQLSFTDEEEESGQQALEKIGIPPDAPFICFAARDTAYLKTIYPDYDFHYHDYRNSNINNYLRSAEAIVERGYYAVRLGAAVANQLDTSNPKIIDYAGGPFRSEFLDIYLPAKCQMFIGSADGIIALPLIFRRPIVIVNFVPIGDLWNWSNDYLSIPKKLWLHPKNRLMTFREVFESDVRSFFRTEEYERLEIEVIENTPDEIAAVTAEMDARLNGTWQTTQEDEDLQNRFWSVCKLNYESEILKSRIGAQFLRENRSLLE